MNFERPADSGIEGDVGRTADRVASQRAKAAGGVLNERTRAAGVRIHELYTGCRSRVADRIRSGDVRQDLNRPVIPGGGVNAAQGVVLSDKDIHGLAAGGANQGGDLPVAQ